MNRENAKISVRVYKARPYSIDKYCKHGGNSHQVPISTKGKITYQGEYYITVRFDCGTTWNLHPSEIEPVKPIREPVSLIGSLLSPQ